ncbi:MAG: ATP-binding protein [Anaerolineae bacterium]
MQSVRVLVIDDELGIREGCRRALIPYGFQVEVAENGPAGLRMLREGHFDVLLLDAMLPGMSGLEVLEQVRRLYPDLICIIVTGYATVELAIQAIRQGAHDFIAKPFTAEMLLQVINRELERQRLQREARKVQHLEEEARELARAKAELEKLAAVESRFMLTMVHILRAPVAVMQNTIQLIRKGYVPPEEQAEVLERVEQRAGELLATLDDLLMLAYLKERVGVQDAHEVSVAEILEGILPAFASRAKERGLELQVEIAERPYVRANPDHIKALWSQLLDNAIRYTPAGGRVTVMLSVDQEHNQAVGVVSDTGIGIDINDIPRIFEDFYRAEAARRLQETGTGLGLSIVREVVELYGGTIEVHSEAGQGSTFRFRLPLGAPAGAKA